MKSCRILLSDRQTDRQIPSWSVRDTAVPLGITWSESLCTEARVIRIKFVYGLFLFLYSQRRLSLYTFGKSSKESDSFKIITCVLWLIVQVRVYGFGKALSHGIKYFTGRFAYILFMHLNDFHILFRLSYLLLISLIIQNILCSLFA